MSKKGKIIVISAVFPPEPVVSAQLSWDIATELSQKNSVVVLSPKPTRPYNFQFEKHELEYSFEHIVTDSYTCPKSKLVGRMRESYSFGKCCAKYIEAHKNEISVVYANTWPLFSQKAIVKSTKKYKIPCILHIQDIYPESIAEKLPPFFSRIISAVYAPMDKYILKNATHSIGISRAMIAHLSATRDIPEQKFTLVRNWQDDDTFVEYTPRKREDNLFTFMYAGSIAPSAGVENVIKAYHQISDANTKLIIAGNGTDKEKCVRIARELNNRSIDFLEVSPDKVSELQAKADVLVLPLKKGIAKTATPSKLTAYLLSAKPVIACVEQGTDVADIINNGKCGFIVEPEEVDKLAKKMRDMIELDSKVLLEMGQNGRNFALKKLSKTANLTNLVTLIENYI